MKNVGATIIATAILFGGPIVASAATVQIYTTVTNAHGGALFGADLTKCVTSNSQQECIKGPATFTVSAGSYVVTPVLPVGYAAELSAGCSGSIGSDDTAACHIDWTDGAPIVAPTPAPVPQLAPQPTPEPQGTSVPIPTGILTPAESLATPEPTPAPEVITKTIIVHEYTPVPATTTIESPTTTQQIEDLQERVGLLEQVIRILQDLIGDILNFLGL